MFIAKSIPRHAISAEKAICSELPDGGVQAVADFAEDDRPIIHFLDVAQQAAEYGAKRFAISQRIRAGCIKLEMYVSRR